MPFPSKGKRPYQSVRGLNELRDIIAQGKPEQFEITVQHPAIKNPALIKYNLDGYVTPERAEQAIAETKQLVESLNASFLAQFGYDLILPPALEGASAFSSGGTCD